MLRKIVLVEDDDVIWENYAEFLADEGFEVKTFRNMEDSMASFKQELLHIAILDISLDEEREGGFQLCMYLRQLTPVLPFQIICGGYSGLLTPAIVRI